MGMSKKEAIAEVLKEETATTLSAKEIADKVKEKFDMDVEPQYVYSVRGSIGNKTPDVSEVSEETTLQARRLVAVAGSEKMAIAAVKSAAEELEAVNSAVSFFERQLKNMQGRLQAATTDVDKVKYTAEVLKISKNIEDVRSSMVA